MKSVSKLENERQDAERGSVAPEARKVVKKVKTTRRKYISRDAWFMRELSGLAAETAYELHASASVSVGPTPSFHSPISPHSSTTTPALPRLSQRPAVSQTFRLTSYLQEDAMFQPKLLCTVILTLSLTGSVAAQRVELTSLPQATNRVASGNVDNLDTTLVRLVADWISNVFGLPELKTLPVIRRFPDGKSAFLSSAAIASDRFPDTAVINYQRSRHEMLAHYDDATKTIYLPDGWTGSTPGEMSVLVHATAHHFQNVSGRANYDCAEERKALPYEAQERWLGLYDRSLLKDFSIEPATLMLITQCMP